MTGDDYNKVLAVTTAGYMFMETIPFDHLADVPQQHGGRSAPSWDCDPKDRASSLVPVYGRHLGYPNSILSFLPQPCRTQMLIKPV
jgi:hypothetical protein